MKMKMKTPQNLWDTVKALLRNLYSIECLYYEERSKINDLSFHLRIVEREGKIKSKVKRRKEIIKIRAEIS